jgi:hypothetical protein
MTDFAAWCKFDADAAAEVVDKEVCTIFAVMLGSDPEFRSEDPACLNLLIVSCCCLLLQADREQKQRELRAKEASAAAQDVSLRIKLQHLLHILTATARYTPHDTTSPGLQLTIYLSHNNAMHSCTGRNSEAGSICSSCSQE